VAPPARTVAETVSVVLRRQVPVRFDEPARSWIGGLPRMPEDVPWPTATHPEHPDRGERPLHFVAQVACADLPRELWGGLGPRGGWLLLFVDGRQFDFDENPRALRVLHVPALGPERPLPPATLPVHDEGYTGYDYGFVRGQDEVPRAWRRWPVDLVVVPNRPVGDPGFPTITPEHFAATLYDGAPVAERAHPYTPAAFDPPFDGQPYTWRGALHVVDAAARVLSKHRPTAGPDERDAARIEAPGWVASTIAAIDAAAADLERQLAEAPAERFAAYLEGQRAQLARTRAYLHEGGAPIAPALLLDRLRASEADFAAWRASRLPVLAALRAGILARDLDGPMSPAAFAPIRHALANDAHERWVLSRGRPLDLPAPVPTVTSLDALARRGYDAALHEVAADLYVASPEKRALIPPGVLAWLEPHWRALDGNRPHRMGGLHDGVQSTPEPGPQSEVLLFQVATDYAMQWCWGDAGAIYVFAGVARLAAHDFAAARGQMESH
jgi:hypothetical protein